MAIETIEMAMAMEPFGLTNAVPCFQRIIDDIIKSMFSVCYFVLFSVWLTSAQLVYFLFSTTHLLFRYVYNLLCFTF